MLIDWFTVGAQGLNFLILLYLLRRFLYQPILHAIDAREKKIAEKLACAQQLKADAEQQCLSFEHDKQQFDQQKQQLMQEALNEAKAEKEQLIAEVKASADIARQKALSDLAKEIQSLQDEIAQKSLQHIYANTEKLLQDLAGLELQASIFQVFIRRLQEQLEQPHTTESTDQQATLVDIVKQSQTSLVLRSAMPLTQPQQETIAQCLAVLDPLIVKDASRLKFVVIPGLVCGLELVADGWRLCWSAQDYLANLQASGKTLVKLLPTSAAEDDPARQLQILPEPNKKPESIKNVD